MPLARTFGNHLLDGRILEGQHVLERPAAQFVIAQPAVARHGRTEIDQLATHGVDDQPLAVDLVEGKAIVATR